MFKPSKFPENRLRAIGYTNHVACIAGLPALSTDRAKHVAKCLVALRHTFTRNSGKLFEDNQLELTTRKVSYRGAIPSSWSTSGNPFVGDLSGLFTSATAHVQVGVHDLASHDLVLNCPVCDHKKNCIHTCLIVSTSWKTLRCAQCFVAVLLPDGSANVIYRGIHVMCMLASAIPTRLSSMIVGKQSLLVRILFHPFLN